MKIQLPILLLIVFFIDGCTLFVGSPPYSAFDFQINVEMSIGSKDYSEALSEAKKALRFYPEEGFFHLRKAEILEIFEKDWFAARAYKNGRSVLEPNDPWHKKISYRYGLFLALKERDIDAANEILSEFPPESPYAIDLRGVMALVTGDATKALQIFNEAAGKGLDKDVASRIILHASMAYHAIDDSDRASQALYKAVNLAGKSLLIPQIEAFWEILKKSDQE